ncbi:hypothetical protein V8G54_024801 [Vigna mungo]|uniref:Prohibitin n=1 Tax=Vigna mungo TaxID=3915 RepID=A0AAQ3N717_VIGMU
MQEDGEEEILAPQLLYAYETSIDSQAHGTHTTSTAAGDMVKNANFLGQARGTATGMRYTSRIELIDLEVFEELSDSDFEELVKNRTSPTAASSWSGGVEAGSAGEAEQSKFVVMKAKQERRTAIIRAEGESDVAKLIFDATASAGMGLIELRRIEASREIASTLAKSPNVS